MVNVQTWWLQVTRKLLPMWPNCPHMRNLRKKTKSRPRNNPDFSQSLSDPNVSHHQATIDVPHLPTRHNRVPAPPPIAPLGPAISASPQSSHITVGHGLVTAGCCPRPATPNGLVPNLDPTRHSEWERERAVDGWIGGGFWLLGVGLATKKWPPPTKSCCGGWQRLGIATRRSVTVRGYGIRDRE